MEQMKEMNEHGPVVPQSAKPERDNSYDDWLKSTGQGSIKNLRSLKTPLGQSRMATNDWQSLYPGNQINP